MSLDNVLAIAAAAKGDITLIVVGLLISIPLIIWGSSIVSTLLTKYPILVYIGAGVLGYIAGEMFVQDPKVIQLILHRFEALHWLIPWGSLIAVVLIGYIWRNFKSPAPDSNN
jgi:predicted tellurium resistance membrane protein TerC